MPSTTSTTTAAAPDTRVIKALAAFEPGLNVQPFEYTSRPLGAHDVEIAISHCGICGSDLHTISGGWGEAKFPVVPGHEIVGQVTATGSAVSDLVVGDRVGVGAMVHACLDATTCRECAAGWHPHCPRRVFTYNSTYEDGEKSYGGYAEFVRVDGRFAFKIPSELPSDVAAPLLCAGITVYTPIKEHVRPGQRVGVVGIGGLGHLALQFIRAVDATPVAVSHSPNKEQSARQLGAEDFVVISNPQDVERAKRTLDVLVVTADAENQPYDLYMSLLRTGGTLAMVGAPNDKIQLSPFPLMLGKIKVVGSAIGNIEVTQEMLELAAKKNVRPVIQKMPMGDANRGLQLVHEGKVRYRVVLEN